MDRRRRIGLITILLFMAVSVEARMNIMHLGGGPGGTGAPPASCDANCPNGPYQFFWDGDNSTSETHACTTDCTASDDKDAFDGTDRIAAGGHSGQAFTAALKDQYVEWTVAADDLVDDGVGTIWVSVYAAANMTAYMTIVEICTSADNCANNRIMLQLSSHVPGRVHGGYEGNNVLNSVNNSGVLYNIGSWSRIGYTWDLTAAAGSQHCVKKCDGDMTDCSAWSCQDTLTAYTPASTQDYITIGENGSAGGDGGGVIIDNVFVTDGYQDSDPCSAALCP